MGQITSGVRAVLSHPRVYAAFQALMGGRSARERFVRQNVRPVAGMKVLDIGCGPAGILDYLPDVQYWGFDVSEKYIEAARMKFGERATFNCGLLNYEEVQSLPSFDLVLALGLIHHLDDATARELCALARAALRPGGRLVTIDPCLQPGQSPVARFLVLRDRGQNVRDSHGYEALANAVFDRCNVEVRHSAWIPYTHCIMECEK